MSSDRVLSVYAPGPADGDRLSPGRVCLAGGQRPEAERRPGQRRGGLHAAVPPRPDEPQMELPQEPRRRHQVSQSTAPGTGHWSGLPFCPMTGVFWGRLLDGSS